MPGTTDTGNHRDDRITTIALPFPDSLVRTDLHSGINVSSNGTRNLYRGYVAFTHG